jgi:Ni/Fe-hydrogenase 1 B-type cytochrome subunit
MTAIIEGPDRDGIADLTAEDQQHSAQTTSVFVYEWPLRLWHWVNAAAILVLALTGYFIGSPLPSVPGESSAHFLMGYIRFAHFAAGYVMAVGLIGRVYWAYAGNHHARQLFILPLRSARFWTEILHEIKWYLFLVDEPKKYVGHNPLAQFSMFFLFTLNGIFMVVTGFALYAEGAGHGSWQDVLFGWVIELAGNTQNLHTIHHLGMWVMVCFVMVHVYAAIREDIMSRQSLISTMISGWRMFKD